MFLLFDQDYNMKAYAKEIAQEAKEKGLKEGLEQGIEKGLEKGRLQGMIEACQNLNIPIGRTVDMVAEKFNFSKGDAAKCVYDFWKEEN